MEIANAIDGIRIPRSRSFFPDFQRSDFVDVHAIAGRILFPKFEIRDGLGRFSGFRVRTLRGLGLVCAESKGNGRHQGQHQGQATAQIPQTQLDNP